LIVTDTPPAPIATLLENYRAFLRYLERREGYAPAEVRLSAGAMNMLRGAVVFRL
jgi:hypothetical protein